MKAEELFAFWNIPHYGQYPNHQSLAACLQEGCADKPWFVSNDKPQGFGLALFRPVNDGYDGPSRLRVRDNSIEILDCSSNPLDIENTIIAAQQLSAALWGKVEFSGDARFQEYAATLSVRSGTWRLLDSPHVLRALRIFGLNKLWHCIFRKNVPDLPIEQIDFLLNQSLRELCAWAQRENYSENARVWTQFFGNKTNYLDDVPKDFQTDRDMADCLEAFLASVEPGQMHAFHAYAQSLHDSEDSSIAAIVCAAAGCDPSPFALRERLVRIREMSENLGLEDDTKRIDEILASKNVFYAVAREENRDRPISMSLRNIREKSGENMEPMPNLLDRPVEKYTFSGSAMMQEGMIKMGGETFTVKECIGAFGRCYLIATMGVPVMMVMDGVAVSEVKDTDYVPHANRSQTRLSVMLEHLLDRKVTRILPEQKDEQHMRMDEKESLEQGQSLGMK